jgi:tetratricopeptide (TPR) repeat protein
LKFARTILIIACMAMGGILVRAEDRVRVSSGNDNERTLVGIISDYTGKELRIELATGQQVVVPAARVLEVQSNWSEAHQQADDLAARHDYEGAIDAYRRAVSSETRAWVRRRILASVTTVYENQGEIARAGDTFLTLMKADEHWQYLERIPLAWTSSFADGAVEARAESWLATSDLPPAVLLGASWSLAGRNRTAAMAALRKLSDHTDRRIAMLAEAQLWRANLASVGTQEVNAWETQIARMPAELRAGPYTLAAKGWLTQDSRQHSGGEATYQRAVWAAMRVPVLFPERHALAAEALASSAEALGKLRWTEEAQSVDRELAENFPETAAGQAAQRRLQMNTSGQK